MEGRQLIDIIHNPDLIKALSLEDIDRWIEKSPYMQSLHMIKALKLKSIYGDDPKLYHKIATVMTDRVKLYEMLNRPYPALEEEEPDTPMVSEEENDKELVIDKKLLNLGPEVISPEIEISGPSSIEDSDDEKNEIIDDADSLESLETSVDETTEEEITNKDIADSDIEEVESVVSDSTSDLQDQKEQESLKRGSILPPPTEDTGLSEFSLWLLALRRTDESVDSDRLEKSVSPDEEVVSETLADLLVKQGHTEKAIKMYEKLSLLNPEKSAYFAQLLEKLKDE